MFTPEQLDDPKIIEEYKLFPKTKVLGDSEVGFIIEFGRNQSISIIEVEYQKLLFYNKSFYYYKKCESCGSSILDEEKNKQEWKAKIIRPTSLYEKNEDGTATPPEYYWHAFHFSLDECYSIIEKEVRESYLKKICNVPSPKWEELSQESVVAEEINKSIGSVKVLRL